MKVITEKDTDFVVGFTNSITDDPDTDSFINNEENTVYYNGQYQYYDVESIPGGVTIEQYKYTPDDGFTLQYTMADMLAARMALIRLDSKSQVIYKQFSSEKEQIGVNIKRLSDESLTQDERVSLLEEIVCDLYEEILNLGGENE